MRTNNTKVKLSQGKVVFGAIVNEYSPGTVEMFGAIGFDFVMIDCEHGPMSVDQVENMVRGAEFFGITPIARIQDHDDATILRFLHRLHHLHRRREPQQLLRRGPRHSRPIFLRAP